MVQTNVLYSTGSQPQITPLGQSNIPLVLPSSGAIGNNGALTGLTALPIAYGSTAANGPGAYMSFPAGAIAAGVPAVQTFYWVVMSSATAGTIFNNTYVSGTPTIPASPAPFVTTGPGAYTQVLTAVPLYVLTVPGNTLGPNDTVEIEFVANLNSSASNKNISARFGTLGSAASIYAAVATASASIGVMTGFSNRGALASQVGLMAGSQGGPGISGGTPATLAVDTTANQSLYVQAILSLATDWVVLEHAVVKYIPGVP